MSPPAPPTTSHPLFPGVVPAWIEVRRLSPEGYFDACERLFHPGELRHQGDVFALFGGGAFLLFARGADADGEPGGILADAQFCLDLPELPLNPGPRASLRGPRTRQAA